MYWEAERECMARDDLEQLQLERLQSTLYRVGTHVPFYKKKFDQLKFNYDSIRSLDDLRHLPFTEKQDLRDNYPFGIFAVPREQLSRIHASSGTTGPSGATKVCGGVPASGVRAGRGGASVSVAARGLANPRGRSACWVMPPSIGPTTITALWCGSVRPDTLGVKHAQRMRAP